MKPLAPLFAHPGLTRAERAFLGVVAAGIAASLVLHWALRTPALDLVTDNVRWTAENAIGCLVLALRWRAARAAGDPEAARRLGWFALGAAGYVAGEIVWVIGVATHTLSFPGFSDLLFPLMPIFLGIGLLPMLDRGLKGKQRRAVWLDMAGLLLMVSTLTGALYLPHRGPWSAAALFAFGLYPILFLSVFGMMLLTVLVRRLVPGPGVAGALLGMGLLSVSWLQWNLDYLRTRPTEGGLLSYGFSFGHVLLFFGLALWREESCDRSPFVRWFDRLHRLLPLLLVLAAGVGVAVAYGALRLGGDTALAAGIYAGSGAMVVCAMLRQVVLLYEQDRELAAEQRLRERELYFQAIFENSSDLIIHVRVEGGGRRFVYSGINPAGARLTGIDPVRFVGSTPEEYFAETPARAAVFASNYRRCVEADGPISYEILLTPPGGTVVMESTLVPVRDEAGRITHILGISRNITAQRTSLEAMQALTARLEQQVADRTARLEEAYREMESFSYSVSHDLRSPLRGINGFCNALVEDFGELLPAEGRRYLSRVQDASRRMSQIIDDLLSLARVTRCSIAPTDDVDLSALARHIAEGLRGASPSRAATADFLIVPGLLARCDARLMEHVLENLLGNAWKYTARHPSARIEFGALPPEPGKARVYYVRDDGAGFDMRFAEKLFQNFQRLHSQAEFEGTGVGLAIVARILQRHGGRIWAEGAVEQGATFRFTLEPDPAPTTPFPAPDFIALLTEPKPRL